MHRRVLYATDLSECAGQAARFSRQLVPTDAQRRVIHVLFHLERPGYFRRAAREQAATESDRRLVDARAETESWWTKWMEGAHDTVVREGNVAAEVERDARDWRADLLVLGAHGMGAFERAILGSSARRLVRHSPCDALVVRDAAEGAQVRRVLLATDFFDPSKLAAKRALEIVKATGASLTACHVIDDDLWTAAAYDSRVEGKVDKAWLLRTVGEMMREFNAEVLGGIAEEKVDHGRPAATTARIAREVDADLVVVGTHGAGAVERALLGSVAEGIVERAPCSVLVVKQPHA